jgi:hypothetical protein
MVGSAAPSRTMHRIAPLSEADMDDPGRPPRGVALLPNDGPLVLTKVGPPLSV